MSDSDAQIFDWNKRHEKRRPAIVPIVAPVPAGGGYGAAALAAETAAVADAVEGTRNDALNIAAFNLGQLVPAGHLSADTIIAELTNAARRAGLDEHEIAATLQSGLKSGMQFPRDVEASTGVAALVEEVSIATLTGSGGGSGGAQHDDALDDDSERERTSWWASAIVERAAGADTQPGPTMLVRDDDQALFYAAKVNGLIGESESGKSWVLLFAIAQALARGYRVLLLDFEDAAPAILGRLQSLGSTVDDLALLDYASPDESLGVLQAKDLAEVLANSYALIGVDGVNAAMTLLGFDLNSNTDATLFATKLLRPLARTGAAVVTVDHLPKNADNRGKGGIGAQAKRAMMDGCALSVEVVEPFGKGQNGILKLKVDKDRPGVVRGVSGGSVLAGTVYVTSSAEDGTVSIRIGAPDLRPADQQALAPSRLTGLMEIVSRHLESQIAPVSTRETLSVIKSRHSNTRSAIHSLVAEGYVSSLAAPGNNAMLTSIAAYRQANDPDSDVFEKGSNSTLRPVSPSESRVSPGFGAVSESRPPSPLRGGTHSDGLAGPAESRQASPAEIVEGYSHCNRCSNLVPDWLLDQGRGLCSTCVAEGR